MEEFKVEYIPALPSVMLELMRFDPSNPDSDGQALERIIMPDKGICSEVLRVANSALYGRSGKIKDIRGAITLMGVKPTKNLVILLSTKSIHGKLKGDTYKRNLVEYPIVSALVAIDLARPAGRGALREDAFLGALLHKIGMTIIGLNRPDNYNQLLDRSARGEGELSELERSELNTDHIKVGEMIFEAWKIPQEMRDIITRHDEDPAGFGEGDDLVRLVSLAGMIARKMLGLWSTEQDEARRAVLAKHFGLGEDKLAIFENGYYEQIKDHPFYEQAMA